MSHFSPDAYCFSQESPKHLLWNILPKRSWCAYQKQLLVCYNNKFHPMWNTVCIDSSLCLHQTNISKVCNDMFTSIIWIMVEHEIFNHNLRRKQPWVYEGEEIEQKNSKGLIQYSTKILWFVCEKRIMQQIILVINFHGG